MHKIDISKVFEEFQNDNDLNKLINHLSKYILLNDGLEYLVNSYMNTVIIKSGSLNMCISKKANDNKIKVIIADRLKQNVVKEILGIFDTYITGLSFFKIDKITGPITADRNQLSYLLSSDIDGEKTHTFIHGFYCIIPFNDSLIIIKID